jgi:hypothetical protein
MPQKEKPTDADMTGIPEKSRSDAPATVFRKTRMREEEP